MGDCLLAPRLRRLPAAVVCGREVRLAVSPLSRLLGLSGLPAREVGGGLLIPRCRSVHTFGMRFRLDVVFLDSAGAPLEVRGDVGAGRVLWCRAATAVLEAPVGRPGARAARHPFHAAFI
jgi:hypothetical protein